MAADPWWMCKLVGLCKDPPVYEGQPQWWRDVRRPTASLWSAEEETLAPRSIHLKPPPPPSQTLIPSQQHNHSLQPPASALPLQTPSPYKRISLPPAKPPPTTASLEITHGVHRQPRSLRIQRQDTAVFLRFSKTGAPATDAL
eukprot:GHVN01030790.1.p1 GENE.GHVN01030790.1~~GHVN01030790.1.p1  ORF type:complete len:143 (+),score=8.32 GHVN01030790.1:133-561(+)